MHADTSLIKCCRPTHCFPPRRVLSAWILALSVLVAGGTPSPALAETPRISAPEAIVIDGWTGQILYARRPEAERDPASTVKMMTSLVLFRKHVNLNRVVTVSSFAASYGGSTAGLYAGERITVRDLFYGMLLPSGNDAAIALSEVVSPTIAGFARLMNAQARRLGLEHTHFLTPNGFDTTGQYTSARDLAVLARAVMHWAIFRRVVGTQTYTARSADGLYVHTWQNTNLLLQRGYPIDGVKTGTTPGAGACLVASARRGTRWIISVEMGDSEADRFTDGLGLLNYGFAHDPGLPGAD